LVFLLPILFYDIVNNPANSISVFKQKLESLDFPPLCDWNSLGLCVSFLRRFLLLDMRQCLHDLCVQTFDTHSQDTQILI